MSEKNFMRDFSPAWFASVMGTGILATTSMFYASVLPFLRHVAFILWLFNIALFLVLLFFWVMRWIKYPQNAAKDLSHPVNSQFYPTMPIGFIVLAGNFLQIGKPYLPASTIFAVVSTFWVIGSVITLVFAFLLPYRTFVGTTTKPEHMNPSWFIPPVALIILPLIGGQVLQGWPSSWQGPILLFNIICWASGFFLYIFLSAIALSRFILHDPLPPQLLPTVWINLGPIGAGVMAFLVMAKSSAPLIQVPVSGIHAFSLIFWGFGIWWLVMSIIMTFHYIGRKALPFAMSWWAFVFPLGAYVGSCYMLYTVYGLSSLNWIGFGLYWLLLFLWIITSWKTIVHLVKGDLFVPAKG
jgi:C4-dicarboxylate transporter/malic acid transport protein